MQKINISHVSNMHNQWLRTMNFYKTELSIMKGILTEIAGKYTNLEIAKDVEQFENQFRVQTNNIDTISHDIHTNIHKISVEAQNNSAGYIDGALVHEHALLGDRTADEAKTASELVHKFRAFAERWM